MAGSLSNYAENALVNALLRNTAFTSPTTVYAALFTAVTDGEAGTVTEVSGNNYSRVAVTFSAPSNGATSNSSDLTFPTPSANWGTIVGVGIYDASTAGNLLAYDGAITSKTVNSGDTVKILSGQLTFSLT
jgi:hypothetical protein